MIQAAVYLVAAALAAHIRPLHAHVKQPAGVAYMQVNASDAAAGDSFGSAVAISEDGMFSLVAAINKRTADRAQGVVYVFKQEASRWVQQAELVANDTKLYGDFGWSVALNANGSYAIVGAGLDDVYGTGVAYVFARADNGNWTKQQKLSPSGGREGDYFGYSVALNGDGTQAVVGAPYTKEFEGSEGAAYMYSRNGSTWTYETKVIERTPAGGDHFGCAVAINSAGTTALIGARNHLIWGAVFAFSRGDSGKWQQDDELSVSGSQSGFGYAVAMDSTGDTAVIGTPTAPPGYQAVYIFVHNASGWFHNASIKVDAGYFGYAVAMAANGTGVVVGAPLVNSSTGAAFWYVLRTDGWELASNLTAQGIVAGESFGASVAATQSAAFVGADKHTVSQNRSQGAAYVFDL